MTDEEKQELMEQHYDEIVEIVRKGEEVKNAIIMLLDIHKELPKKYIKLAERHYDEVIDIDRKDSNLIDHMTMLLNFQIKLIKMNINLIEDKRFNI